jgi:hypothetical protein
VKKIITVLLMFLFIRANAQYKPADTKGFRLSGGLTLALPVSNLPLWPAGIGADLLAQYGVTPHLAVTGDAGLTSLFGRKDIKNYTIVPVRLGLRYFATQNFYLAAKTGVGFLKVKGIDGATALAYSVGGGIVLKKKTDLSVMYDGYSKDGTIGLIAFRVGYFFNND